MKIALIGATGFVGSAILKEALDRGHEVTAIARHPEKLQPHERLHSQKGDVYKEDEVARLVSGHDAVISAFSPSKTDPDIRRKHVDGVKTMIPAIKRAGIKRLLVVGGAGTLEVKPGLRVIDTPDFPEQWKGTARATADVLDILRGERDLDWTFLSPAAMLQPGARTGKFRQGADQLLVDANGKSSISAQDYAVAMIDEVETPKHVQQRFTVGYGFMLRVCTNGTPATIVDVPTALERAMVSVIMAMGSTSIFQPGCSVHP